MSGVFRSNLWAMILSPSNVINRSVFRSGLRTHQSLDLLISKRCFSWHATVCFRRLGAAKFDRYAWISIEYPIESAYWQRCLLFIENTIDKRKFVSAEIYSWALVTKAKESNSLCCLIKSINRQTWRNSFACMLTFDIDGVAAAAVDSLFNWHDFKAWSPFSFVLVWAVLGENGCHQHGVNVCLRLGANELTAIMKNYTTRFFVNSIIKVVWTNSNILGILLTMKVIDRVRVE